MPGQDANRMKKLFILTLGLFILLIGQKCPAQDITVDVPKIKFWDIQKFISKNYKLERGFLDTACVHTIVLLKFKVIKSRVDSVEFTRSIPLPIKRALENALRVNKGGVTLTDGKSYENKTVIIPIEFAYLTHCKKPEPIEIDSNGAIINLKRRDQTSLSLAIMDMLNFESGSRGSVDCILLGSMSFAALF